MKTKNTSWGSILRKFIIAVVSAVIFSLFFAFIQYVPKDEQEPNVLYMSFFEIISASAIYSAPVFILGGIPSTILIDKINKRWAFSSRLSFYFLNFVLYLIAGIITTGIFVLILSKGSWHFNVMFFVLGSLASLLFYHISLIHKKVEGSNDT